MRTYLSVLSVLFVMSAHAQVAAIRWDVQVDRPVDHDLAIWQGETVDLLPRLVQGTSPVAVTNAPVEFRYREDALATNLYRVVTCEANTNSGVLAVRWLPEYDVGASAYDYQIIVGSNATNPRCFGRITMRETIGWLASTNAPPATTLYPTQADLQALSNTLASALQEGLTNTVPAQIASAVAPLATTQHVADVTAHITDTNLHLLAGDRAKIDGAWQNPSSATNWTWTSDGVQITLTGYTGPNDVVIPDMLDGLPVTVIGDGAFSPDYSGLPITSISGGNNIEIIGSYAFVSCNALTTVTLPNATTIGNSAFKFCGYLTTVTLPNATTIGHSAFCNCSTLTTVTLPNATTIVDRAFDLCVNLTSIYFGGNVPSIGNNIFFALPANQVTNYVTNPQATGWGEKLGGMPVVRLDLHGDKIYQAGELVATTGHVAQAIAAIPEPDLSGKLDRSGGIATNLTLAGWLQLPQTAATNLVLRMWTSNEVIYAAEVYQ